MKYKIGRCLVTAFALISAYAYATPPNNLSCLKAQISHYYESGQYTQDVAAAVTEAETYLRERLNDNTAGQAKKLAIVLDIDDTSISHYALNKRNDFSLSDLGKIINNESKSPAVKPVLALFNEAIKNGVAVFFISMRPDEARATIIANLQNAGYAGWTAVYLPVGDEEDLASDVYKTAKRKLISDQGYQIILNIGDQDSDLAGGYAEKTVKIPNPMYGSPSSCPTHSTRACA